MRASWTRLLATWDRWWFAPGSLLRLDAFRIVTLLAALHAVMTHRFGVLDQANGRSLAYLRRHWEPIYAFEVLGVEPPSAALTRAVLGVTCAAVVFGIAGVCTRAACALVALGTFWWLGVAYSLGKPHHGDVALVFALFALPLAPVGRRLALPRWWRASEGEPAEAALARLPLALTAATIAIGYFFAGASKVAIGGLEWMNGYTLQGIVLQFHAPMGESLARSVTLARLSSIALVTVQIAFPLVFVWKRSRWFFLPAAVTFHIVSWQTMSTGPFLSLWSLLVCFLPLERFPQLLTSGLAWRRAALGAVALAGLCAYASIYVVALPGSLRPGAWGLAALPAGAIAVKVLSLDRRPRAQSAGNNVRSS